MTIETTPRRALTIHFQGLCAFLRNHREPASANEVAVVVVAGHRAVVKPPKLCLHTPVLTFDPADFVDSSAATHSTLLLPGSDRFSCAEEKNRARPALGIWSLGGKDLRILSASPRALQILPPHETADLHALTANGAANGSCLDPVPPPELLVDGRIFLTSGTLASSAKVGDDEHDQWTFDHEEAEPPTGDPVVFSQELRYDFFSGADKIVLEAKPIGGETSERITFTRGASITISNLCAAERRVPQGVRFKERDFLAYYDLLRHKPEHRLIPHRLSSELLTKVGMSACPPATTFLE